MTELVAGVDIVREQFLVAAGLPLGDDVVAAGERASDPSGHAIEVRITAEDPSRAFAPTPGRVGRWVMPSGPGVRVDTAIESGDRVPPEYDNLIAKLLVHGPDRDAAIDRLRRALDETEIGGVQTTLPFHRFVASSEAFRAADLSTGWVGRALGWRGRAPHGGREGAARRRARRRRRSSGDVGTRDAAAADARDARTTRRAATALTGDGWRRDGRARMVDRWPG